MLDLENIDFSKLNHELQSKEITITLPPIKMSLAMRLRMENERGAMSFEEFFCECAMAGLYDVRQEIDIAQGQSVKERITSRTGGHLAEKTLEQISPEPRP